MCFLVNSLCAEIVLHIMYILVNKPERQCWLRVCGGR